MSTKKKKNNNKKRQEILNQKNKLFKSITLIFVIAIIVTAGWILLFKTKSYVKNFENDYMAFKYDTTWQINKQKTNSVSLTHKTKSFIDIKVTSLSSNMINSDVQTISDEVRYDIEKQNSQYKLLKEEKKVFSENKYEGYKLLYENGESQTLVVIMKKNNYLYVINYTSNNEYFDILLDNFQFMLGSLNLK